MFMIHGANMKTPSVAKTVFRRREINVNINRVRNPDRIRDRKY